MGVFTQRYDPKKIVILMVLIWSIATVLPIFTSSVYVILICRLVLALPKAFIGRSSPASPATSVSDKERTQANSIIQYYDSSPGISLDL